MDRTKNAIKGINAGIINYALTMFLPFISRTIIIYTLGAAYVGLGGLFGSIISVLNITELGFGSAISYILYKPVADGNKERIRAILSFARKCFTIIGFIVLALGLVVLPFLDRLTSTDRPADLNIYILYFIYLINTVISYWLFSYKRVLLSAYQRYDLETTIGSVSLIIQNILQVIILLITKNYYLYVLMNLVSTVLSNIFCHIATNRLFPDLFCEGSITKVDKQLLRSKVGGAFFSKIGSVVFLSVDNIVISAIFGLIVLGKYSNYYYVLSVLISLFAVIHNTLRPILGNYIITKTNDDNYTLFSSINYIYTWIAAFCTCCLIVLYQDFIYVWAGESYLFPNTYVYLIGAMFYIGRLHCIPTLYVEAAGLWWESRYVYISAAAVNLTLNIILSLTIGFSGVIISTIIASILVSSVGYFAVLFRHYFTGKALLRKTMVEILINTAIQTAIILFVWYVLEKVHIRGWIGLFGKGFLCAIVFGILSIISMAPNPMFRRIVNYARGFLQGGRTT